MTGTAIPEADSMVAASGQGVVRIIHVARGQAVRRGEPLVTLDVRAASLSVRAARSRLDSLRTQSEQMTHECTRAERLAASGALPEAERARQAANCAAQVGQISAVEAEVALASTRVQDGAIRAPFDGVVVEVLVEVGEFVAPPQPVLRLVDVDPLHVEVRVPAQHAADLQIGQRAWVSSSIDGERSGATVAFLSPTLQFDSRERVADLVLSTPSPFLAGAFVVVRFDPNPLATAEGGH